MSANIRWNGFFELRQALRELPAHLTGEGSHIVEGTANSAAVEIRSIYGAHRRTGNLQDGVEIQQKAGGQFGTAIQVKSTAPHAWLFDNGSQARHYITASGAEHKTGAMWGKTPPTHAFVRTMIKHRRRMYEQLKAMLMRHGLIVSGEP